MVRPGTIAGRARLSPVSGIRNSTVVRRGPDGARWTLMGCIFASWPESGKPLGADNEQFCALRSADLRSVSVCSLADSCGAQRSTLRSDVGFPRIRTGLLSVVSGATQSHLDTRFCGTAGSPHTGLHG